MIELYNGDCLEFLETIPDQSTNLTLTSPPYNMNLRIRDGKYCSRQIVKEISTKYTNYSDNLSIEEYFEFNRKVLELLLKKSELIFYNIQFLTGNKRALFKLIGHFSEQIKEVIIWDKITAEPAIGEGVLNSRFEVILVLESSNAISRKFSKANFKRGTLENIWQIKRGKKVCKEHGAVFPLELATKVLTNFSSKGDKILDPFMGTGTTGEAAILLDRDFVGCEVDQGYFEFAEKRLYRENI